MSPTNSPAEPFRVRPQAVFAIAAAALGLVSVLVAKLAIPAMMLMLIAYLTLPREKDGLARLGHVLLMAATPLMLIGLLRFTIEEAAPGMAMGGRQQLEKQALYRLREVRLAQDLAREQAPFDPDGDGIGSAGTLDELSGHLPFRGGEARAQGFLRLPPSVEAALGRVSVVQEYAIALYLPAKDGSGVTHGDAIDDEKAERRWVAYAWPMNPNEGHQPVLFIDEHERILVSDNRAPGQGYAGLTRMPRFDAALTGATLDATAASDGVGQDGGRWQAWKGKQPRASLPGDR